METINVKAEDLKKLIRDVAQIKEMLIAEKEENEIGEIELTDWAKKELEEARKRKKTVSHEEVRKMILAK